MRDAGEGDWEVASAPLNRAQSRLNSSRTNSEDKVWEGVVLGFGGTGPSGPWFAHAAKDKIRNP